MRLVRLRVVILLVTLSIVTVYAYQSSCLLYTGQSALAAWRAGRAR